MATGEFAAHAAHAHAGPTSWIRKYVFSLDHKVIGMQYYFLALTAVFVGMILSLLMRIHLIWPTATLPFFGEIKPETYLSLLTMHGTIMVFFVLTTAPQGGFGNYFLPIQIGAPDMAFPVLNMLSFWVTALAFIVMLAAFFVVGGAPLHGWTGYPPLSALQSAGPGEGLGADLWVISIALFCLGALMSALNFITTTLDMRAKGMTMMRMPLTCWSWFITAILGLLAFGVLLSAGILLLLDRNAGTSFYVPLVTINGQLAGHKGGSPLLWQHLFWFFGHPEVYIAILPAMGLCSQLLSVFSRKPIFGYKAMVYAMLSIGFLGFMVWGHHMFMSGMSLRFFHHDHGHRSSFRDKDFQLARHNLARPNSFHISNAVCPRICFTVCGRRHQRTVSCSARPGYSIARHLFCRRSLPPDHGRGVHLRNLCRHVLLVPKNVWPHDE
jgi:cytochrome c oxidase subunit 1